MNGVSRVKCALSPACDSWAGGSLSAMKTGETFDGIWWSVQVPSGWRARADAKCATFHQARSFGALQISSAQKDTTITDTDLEEFANDRIPEGAELIRVAYSNFSGFTA